MMLEILMILVPAGFILLYDGWRKRRRKGYFAHSPIGAWMLAILPFYPLFLQLEGLMEEPMGGVKIAIILGGVVAIIGGIIYKTYYEITHRRVNIHNIRKSEMEKLLERLLTKHNVSFEKDPDLTGKRTYTFDDSKGKITLETHLASNDHQVVTFSKINEIPKGPEVLEDLKEEVVELERSFSKTLGIAEILSGIALIGIAAALIV